MADNDPQVYAVDVTIRLYVEPLPEVSEPFDPLRYAWEVVHDSDCAELLRPLLAALSDLGLPVAEVTSITAEPVDLEQHPTRPDD